MDIRLNARLSAYGKFPPANCGCSADTVTKEEIDSLFGETTTPTIPPSGNAPTFVTCPSKDVTHEDIDSLFK